MNDSTLINDQVESVLENVTKNKKKEKKPRTNEKALKSMRISFDLNKDFDQNLYSLINSIMDNIHDIFGVGDKKNKVITQEVFVKEILSKVTNDDVNEIILKHMMPSNILSLMTANYNTANSANHSEAEFALDIMPNLKGKELEKLKNIDKVFVPTTLH